MANSRINSLLLFDRMNALGLYVLGAFAIDDRHCAKGRKAFIGHTGFLIGNRGPDMWLKFSRSPEFSDGLSDPMNRWTRRVMATLAQELGCHAVYPFDEPYWPFQKLAMAALGIQPSPLGILIHPEYGLWHALRCLLVFEPDGEMAQSLNAVQSHNALGSHPCDACMEKPCLSACPVVAFSMSGLDVKPCFKHLDAANDPDCMSLGCRARAACPIGTQHQYEMAQVKFHMRSYRGL